MLDSGVGDGAAGHPSERWLWRRAGAVRRGRTARLPKGGRPAPRTGRQAPRNGRTRLPGFPPDASGEAIPYPRTKIIGLDLPRGFHRPHASSRVVHDLAGGCRRFVNHLPVRGAWRDRRGCWDGGRCGRGGRG
ncbi:hypothetical protein KPATCC21470_7821 [Kitasatospora purpeofusca]